MTSQSHPAATNHAAIQFCQAWHTAWHTVIESPPDPVQRVFQPPCPPRGFFGHASHASLPATGLSGLCVPVCAWGHLGWETSDPLFSGNPYPKGPLGVVDESQGGSQVRIG